TQGDKRRVAPITTVRIIFLIIASILFTLVFTVRRGNIAQKNNPFPIFSKNSSIHIIFQDYLPPQPGLLSPLK
ncbi:hypothetical protein, partial [Enterobacter kobei]|uniref:hypothetical protein n=1 Tax=Enterobacter kobei TaxID=208224 RepID=UPI002DB8EB0F